MYDSILRQRPSCYIQLLQLQDLQHQLGLRELQERVPLGTCAPTAPDEPPTDLGLLLLHEEGFVQDREQEEARKVIFKSA